MKNNNKLTAFVLVLVGIASIDGLSHAASGGGWDPEKKLSDNTFILSMIKEGVASKGSKKPCLSDEVAKFIATQLSLAPELTPSAGKNSLAQLNDEQKTCAAEALKMLNKSLQVIQGEMGEKPAAK